jgi:hypothetical protein
MNCSWCLNYREGEELVENWTISFLETRRGRILVELIQEPQVIDEILSSSRLVSMAAGEQHGNLM